MGARKSRGGGGGGGRVDIERITDDQSSPRCAPRSSLPQDDLLSSRSGRSRTPVRRRSARCFGPFAEDAYAAGAFRATATCKPGQQDGEGRTPAPAWCSAGWHMDLPLFSPEPPAISMLYGVDILPYGGEHDLGQLRCSALAVR